MASITKADVSNAAQWYVIDRANTSNYGGGNPYGYGVGLTVNQAMLDSYVPYDGTAWMGNAMSAVPYASQLIGRGREMAKHFARIVRGIYGVSGGNTCPDGGSASPWHAYEIFFVSAGHHWGHYADVVNNVDWAYTGDAQGTMNLQGMRNFMWRLGSVVLDRKNNAEVDLRVCHSSCHGSCHSSRGRR